MVVSFLKSVVKLRPAALWTHRETPANEINKEKKYNTRRKLKRANARTERA